jgi:hypothetical protein
MEYIYEYGFEENIGFLIFYLIYMLLIAALNIASYVLRSLGVYTIAKRRGIRRPWFAWVPVVDYYLLGCISDQYQYVVKGKTRNKRSVLLALAITQTVVIIGMFAAYILLMVNVVRTAAAGMSEELMMRTVAAPAIGILCISLVMMVLAIVTMVFRYMALYDLYTSCSPANNVLFLVLSIVFNVTEPFFIFFSRKKDGGMPPRKTDMPEEIVQEIPEQKVEEDPWDRPDIE